MKTNGQIWTVRNQKWNMTREHVIAHIFFIIISETYLGLKKNIKIPVYADDVMLWTNNAKELKI